MSRELVKKVVEAGIIPVQSIELLRMWKLIDPLTLPGRELEEQTQIQLLRFVEEIALLLEKETEMPELREAVPGVNELFKNRGHLARLFSIINGNVEKLSAFVVESSGSLYVKGSYMIELFMRPGCQIEYDGNTVEIIEVSPVYHGELLTHYRCLVQGVPEYAEMRKMSEPRTGGRTEAGA